MIKAAGGFTVGCFEIFWEKGGPTSGLRWVDWLYTAPDLLIWVGSFHMVVSRI